MSGAAGPKSPSQQPATGHTALNVILPGGGWPDSALSEILYANAGMGELRLLWPALAQLTSAGAYMPYPQAWLAAGVDLCHVPLSGHRGVRHCGLPNSACAQAVAVPCCAGPSRPTTVHCVACRLLQKPVKALGFAYRPLREVVNPSPVALHLVVDGQPAQLRVLK